MSKHGITSGVKGTITTAVKGNFGRIVDVPEDGRFHSRTKVTPHAGQASPKGARDGHSGRKTSNITGMLSNAKCDDTGSDIELVYMSNPESRRGGSV